MANYVLDEYVSLIKPQLDVDGFNQVGKQFQQKLENVLKPVSAIFDASLTKETKKLEVLKAKLVDAKNALGKLTAAREGKTGEYDKLGGTKEESRLQKLVAKLETAVGKQSGAVDKQAAKQSALSANIEAFSAKIGKSAVYLEIFGKTVKIASDQANKLAESAAKLSNRFVSQASVFVDEQTRNLMARYGATATQAQSMTSAAGVLNLNLSDYSRWTLGQRKAFDDLMRHYQEGIESIDTAKLERFNKTTQEYQLMQAKFRMDLELSMAKLLGESDALPKLLNTLQQGMEGIVNILSSPIVQEAFELFTGIINGILKLVTAPLNLLGQMFAGGSTTNNTTNNNVNISAVGGDSRELAIDIGLQLQNVLG